MEKYSYSGPLARALSIMCARTEQMPCALRFGQSWQTNAISNADRDQATAFLARVNAITAAPQSAPH
jgi:hypothetical protein